MKNQSIKDMTKDIIGRVIDRWQQTAKASDPDHQFDVVHFKLKLTPWIDVVSSISDEVIQAAIKTGTKLEIDGHSYVPTDLHIIKMHYASAIAAKLVEAHDKRQSHRIPTNKLFTPSLFATLDYEDARKKWVVLGETNRVEVGDASNYQWRMNDNIKTANFEAQQAAYKVDLDTKERREMLFRQNPDCGNTDALMKKLGAWKG